MLQSLADPASKAHYGVARSAQLQVELHITISTAQLSIFDSSSPYDSSRDLVGLALVDWRRCPQYWLCWRGKLTAAMSHISRVLAVLLILFTRFLSFLFPLTLPLTNHAPSHPQPWPHQILMVTRETSPHISGISVAIPHQHRALLPTTTRTPRQVPRAGRSQQSHIGSITQSWPDQTHVVCSTLRV